MFEWIPVRTAAAIVGIVIVALMIAGTIPVAVDDAWLWSLLALYIVCLVARGRARVRFWEQRWWWELSDHERDAAPPD